MPNEFDEAKNASAQLFEDDTQSVQNGADNTAPPTSDVQDSAGSETSENAVSENAPEKGAQDNASYAAEVAEKAATLASEKDNELKNALTALEEIKAQNENLQKVVDTLSKKNEENVVNDALKLPTLDINGLSFADEETQRAALEKFSSELAQYNRAKLLEELEPVLSKANELSYEKEKEQTLSELKSIPELEGISDMLPQLDRIIETNKFLSASDMPIEEKYITAYAIARGVDAMNTPKPEEKEMSADEFLNLYNTNPAFKELIEKKRIDELNQSQQVPPFSASSGAANAAPTIKEKPKTLEEASKASRTMFGTM